jgi:putative sterol carrier protein
MSETARDILAAAATREQDPRLAGIEGTYRFDVEGAGSWCVAVHEGRVTITEAATGGDCVIRCTEPDFVRIAQGRQNLLTAALQGRVQIEGSMVLAQKFSGFVRAPRAA